MSDDQNGNLTMVNMLKGSCGKLKTTCMNRDMETLRNNKKEMLEVKGTVTEMKTAFGGIISTPDMAEERTGSLEYQSTETSGNEMEKEKRL